VLVIVGAIVLLSIASYFLTTTAEQRAASRRRFARWNPLFIAILIAQLAFIFWPRN
jgi:NADH:ubiquinone oxidoreductase subunit 6 (subunit J)